MLSEHKQKVRQALLDAGVGEMRADAITTLDPEFFHFRDIREIAAVFGIPCEYQWQYKPATMIRPVEMQKHYAEQRMSRQVDDAWLKSEEKEVIFESTKWNGIFMISLKPKDEKQREVVNLIKAKYFG